MKLSFNPIALLSPRWAFSRERYRQALAAYEAAKPSRLRKDKPDNSSGDAVVGRGGAALRGYARQLEQNYDVAKRILDVMVQKIIGAEGISIEPLIRNTDGKLNKEFIREVLLLHTEWKLRPEVTGELNYGAMQRLQCRSWLRDGEQLTQQLMGNVPGLKHGTVVPFSLELIESDLLPFDYDDESKGITQGVERNAWGQPVAYHLYKTHPGDSTYRLNLTTKRVSADRITHLKNAHRIRQARGISILSSIIRRLEDLKDYEESERIAARVDAALTAYIKKGASEDYKAPDGEDTDRGFGMKPGMIFDGLNAGEEVGTIQSNRPSTLLDPFHRFMLRMAAVSAGATYSSVSGDYDGSYSSQRQELVEGYGGYTVLTADFVNQSAAPDWKAFIDMAILSGQLKVPSDVDMRTIYMAGYFGPSMPWIDPVKEANGYKIMERSGYKSAQAIIRKLGDNPQDTMDQIKVWRDEADANELVFDSDPKHERNVNPSSDNNKDNKDNKDKEDKEDKEDLVKPEDEIDTNKEASFGSLKEEADTFAAGVRSGVITPQSEDEQNFRNKAGFVEMSDEVISAWDNDGNVRRPVTLKSGEAFKVEQEKIISDDVNTEDNPESMAKEE